MEEKQTKLETKIRNAAYNADITQSQAHDTRHRRMQEVTICAQIADPLRGEYCIVFIQHIMYLFI